MIAVDHEGGISQVHLYGPNSPTISLSIGASSVASAVLVPTSEKKNRAYRIYAEAKCFYRIGVNPSVNSSNGTPLGAEMGEAPIQLAPGESIAVIERNGSSDQEGKFYITPCEVK